MLDYQTNGKTINDYRLNTRRFPRTLNEAFGPYAGTHYVRAKARDNHPAWWALGVALLAALVSLCFIMS